MLFNFNPKSVLLLIFFAHGMLYALLLSGRYWRLGEKASGWLSGFVFLCALYLVPFMLGYAGWYAHDGYRETLYFIPFQQVLLLGPVLFFYLRSLLFPGRTFTRKDWVHFLPAFLYLGYSLIVFVYDVFVVDTYYFYADGRDKDLKFWYQALGWISLVYYLLESLRRYRNYRKQTEQWVSYADAIRRNWVRILLLAFLILLALRLLFFVLNPEWDEFGRKFWYYICFSGLFLFLSVAGYSHALKSAALPLVSASQALMRLPDSEEEKTPGSGMGKLPEGELSNLKTRIEQALQGPSGIHDPELNLAGLAEILGESPRQVSAAINQGFQTNFNDLVNRFRVDSVQEQLRAGKQDQMTLLGIALECGFNSKATFNRAFKKHTGLSPAEWIRKNLP
ncbi:AraC-type DNA-binding protein [Robiginitalea myxolifaciens]|uniref:AraC-type DNA-binding protein n=1 Tax=Robiginitalea myxolifaciens TaxID=400055 RepID=A0A1I6FMW4_9FLAO|nr:helix-turn-helix domain-containing protein [Robiginitalea myxolifaciens]SFR31305.1 AraC-type DNA-binding protein [Robiginitalea myxolifaciens]